MLSNLTKTHFFRLIVAVVIVAFLSLIPAQSGFAQLALPAAGEMLHVSKGFDPAFMTGLRVDLHDPFSFYFIMNKGEKPMLDDVKKNEYEKLIKYFLTSLTIPNDDMWVNLSPHESNRILPDNFAQTSMGRDLLAQDYILKQFTASLIYPEDELGKKFWAKLYKQAYERFGTTDIPIDTFNKVWIVADKADIYQKDDTAFLVASHLKVMLEQDFMIADNNKDQFGQVEAAGQQSDTQKMASDIVREVIVPIIEKEVNEGENFAQVRQIYSSMILATWFKKTLKESLLGQVYADKSKVSGVEVNDLQAKEKIYRQYLEAYKVGVFNYIKDEVDPATQEMLPRKYFSGGLRAPSTKELAMVSAAQARPVVESAMRAGRLNIVSTLLAAVALGWGALVSFVPSVHAEDAEPSTKVVHVDQGGDTQAPGKKQIKKRGTGKTEESSLAKKPKKWIAPEPPAVGARGIILDEIDLQKAVRLAESRNHDQAGANGEKPGELPKRDGYFLDPYAISPANGTPAGAVKQDVQPKAEVNLAKESPKKAEASPAPGKTNPKEVAGSGKAEKGNQVYSKDAEEARSAADEIIRIKKFFGGTQDPYAYNDQFEKVLSLLGKARKAADRQDKLDPIGH